MTKLTESNKSDSSYIFYHCAGAIDHENSFIVNNSMMFLFFFIGGGIKGRLYVKGRFYKMYLVIRENWGGWGLGSAGGGGNWRIAKYHKYTFSLRTLYT